MYLRDVASWLLISFMAHSLKYDANLLLFVQTTKFFCPLNSLFTLFIKYRLFFLWFLLNAKLFAGEPASQRVSPRPPRSRMHPSYPPWGGGGCPGGLGGFSLCLTPMQQIVVPMIFMKMFAKRQIILYLCIRKTRVFFFSFFPPTITLSSPNWLTSGLRVFT